MAEDIRHVYEEQLSAVKEGLQVDPTNQDLLQLKQEIEVYSL